MQPPVLVLVGTSHPGNVGAIARSAANFGVQQLRFVAPRCEVQGDEARRRAKHALPLLESAQVFDTLEDALVGTSLSVGTTARTTLADNRFLRKPLDVRDWAEGLQDWDGRLAIVFGREDRGLTAEEVNQLDQLVIVPTADYSSLNLAHAVALLCYEHFRVRNQERLTPERTLAPDTLQAMTHAWDCITQSVDGRPWRREVAQGIFRKIVGRSMPSDHEVHNIMGVLTGVLKRFDHPDFRTANSTRVLRANGLLVDPVVGEEEHPMNSDSHDAGPASPADEQG